MRAWLQYISDYQQRVRIKDEQSFSCFEEVSRWYDCFGTIIIIIAIIVPDCPVLITLLNKLSFPALDNILSSLYLLVRVVGRAVNDNVDGGGVDGLWVSVVDVMDC